MRAAFVASCCLALFGCTSDDNAVTPAEDSGVTHVPGVDGSIGQNDATSPGHDSSTGDDSSTGGDTSTGDDGGIADSSASDAPTGDAGDLCTLIPNGTYKATAVACNGTPLNITGVQWIATWNNGAQSSFAETINSCTLTQSGPASCTANVLQHTDTQTSCNPTNCQPFGATTCGSLQPTAYWQVTSANGTVFVLESMNEPDGGPTPIRTCVDQGKQNPVQVTWTKQ